MGIKARIVIWEASLPNLGSLSSHHYGVNRKMTTGQQRFAQELVIKAREAGA
jgi:hypothetical protein